MDKGKVGEKKRKIERGKTRLGQKARLIKLIDLNLAKRLKLALRHFEGLVTKVWT